MSKIKSKSQFIDAGAPTAAPRRPAPPEKKGGRRGRSLNIYLDDGLADRLDEYREELPFRVSRVHVIREAVLDYLNRHEGQT